MSSLIGHLLAGYSVAKLWPSLGVNGNRSGASGELYASDEPGVSGSISWRAWLMCVAILPDLDYPLVWFFHVVLPIRYIHSLGFCLGITLLTLAFLRWRKSGVLRLRGLQVGAAALSHLVLDGLVGICANPWLWPFSDHLYKLPFGILPAAGRLDPFNRYLYINLLIEIAILSPLLWMPRVLALKIRRHRNAGVALGLLLWAPFLAWGASLKR